MALLFERQLQGPQDLEPLVKELLALSGPRCVWLLEGEVGAGKTEMVKALARVLQLKEVASPSFAIHHRYSNSSTKKVVDHLDLYRLEDEADLESTGFWDLFSELDGLIIIEWADRLNHDFLPKAWHRLRVILRKNSLENESTTERKIEIHD